ncbi:ribonuclease J [bacterium]|nr:ribonuclease J [bacterium]
MSSKKLKIIPLGGLGEIGMNCMVLEWDREMVLVDCGIQFPDASVPGVELLTPDLSYVRQNAKRLKGIVLTHGHDDHIGAIPFLLMDLELDVYCTPFPRGLIQNKLQEYPRLEEIRFHEITPRKKFKVGPFTFEALPVAHSIIEATALAIETPVGIVIHSGDFKHDDDLMPEGETGFAAFEEYGKKGVRLLLSDSTNAERIGHTMSEEQVTGSFEGVFEKQKSRLFIALFASNIRRVENLLALAKRTGKKVAFAGRSMHSYTRLAHGNESMEIPEDTVILLERLGEYPDKDVVVLMTGSQAEPGAALVRVAYGTHKDLKLREGDTVVLSSRFIPGNEKAINAMINQLFRAGAEVAYESFHKVHVSGHGFQDELLMLLNAVKPECFIPVHGEYRHLARHARLAISSGVKKEKTAVIENGQVMELSEDGLEYGPLLELRKGVIVEGEFMAGDPALFSQRNSLARTGIAFVSFTRDSRSHKLLEAPVVKLYGILYRDGVHPDDVPLDASEMLEDLYPDFSRREDWQEIVKIELRRFLKKRASHKPVVIAVMQDV